MKDCASSTRRKGQKKIFLGKYYSRNIHKAEEKKTLIEEDEGEWVIGGEVDSGPIF